MVYPALSAALVFLISQIALHGAQLRIACIGDSITFGSGLSNPSVESYPAKLQRLLGTNYSVRNFGISGRTLLEKGDYPYWKEPAFTQSHEWAPDVVIIQLGTNDSKPQNWRSGTNFVSDYEEMVRSYAILTNAPRIMACTPCPVYRSGAYSINPGIVATNIAPAVRDLADRLNLDLVDLHTRLDGHPEWFPDTVHPNSKGMSAMAAVICSALAGEPEDPTPPALELERLAARRFVLAWPANWRSVIVQSSATLPGSESSWTVVEAPIALSGDTVRQTNNVSGVARFYRLWKP